METVELAAVTPAQWTELAAGEREPWGGVAEGLMWSEKDRYVGLLEPDGRLLAVAGSVTAAIDVEPAGRFAVLGIGGVFVTPSARGRGCVAQLLGALLATPPDGADHAMLFCREPLTALYRRFGFSELGDDVCAEQPDGPIEMPMRAMWRPLRDGASWPAGRVTVRGLPF